VAAEAAVSTAAVEVAFTAGASAEVAAISAVAEVDRVSVEAHVTAAQAVFAVAHLGRMARTGEAGRERMAIDLTVRGPMGCTVEEAQLLQVHVTARCRGTELIQR
jgi:hypothetical protein